MRIGGFCLVLVLLLSGCFSGPEWRDPQVSFTVEDIEMHDGGCTDGLYRVSDPICHEVTVSVTNEMQETDLDIDVDDWSVVTREGAVHAAANTEGPEAVAPGYTSEVVFRFELEKNEKIDLVRYKDFFHDRHKTVDAPQY